MIRVRRHATGPVEEMDLGEFERRARAGDIAPQHEVCFPVVTGSRFVPANELELFRGLYAAGAITFRRYFNLGRVPWVTLGLIALLISIYAIWQADESRTPGGLMEQGAKSRTLIVELGQWWRLVTANLLHVSGWHLAINAIFLINLGGPTEAVFRRLDYVIILLASALGTTLLSTSVNPAVSCGASGIVFGVWGAAAVFGVRHRTLLPDRYRRYFIGSVIPYSIFALYIGFAMEGVDNWGHLGGLLAGCIAALFFPARLLEPRDTAMSAKLAGIGAGLLLVALGMAMPAGSGELSTHRYFPKNGLVVPIPSRWDQTVAEREGPGGLGGEAYAFENRAGVIVALETREEPVATSLADVVRDFIERDLAEHLETADVKGVRLLDPEPTEIAGLDARRIRAELLTASGASRADIYLMMRDSYRYLITFNAPLWLFDAYAPTFERILDATQLSSPDAG